MDVGPAPEPPLAELPQAELDARVLKGELAIAARVRQPKIADADRQGSFVEVEGGYTRLEAMAEAARCLSCGVCSECLMCSDVCSSASSYQRPAWRYLRARGRATCTARCRVSPTF